MRTVLALTLTLAITTAVAQTTSPDQAAPPDRRCAPETKQGTPGADLSDKLAKSRGVICPPGVDAEMSQPPPSGGTMKVVPPPGSPGGNPQVQPK